MKDLFKTIQDKLIADVPDLKMIDFDLGQLEQDPLPPLSYPAALISFGESPFEDLGGLSQNATVNIIVRLAFRVFERTHSIAASQYRDIGLGHLDVADSVKWCLHGFGGDCFSELSHRAFATEPRADLRVYTLAFETLYHVAPPTPQYVTWGAAGGQGDAPEICLPTEGIGFWELEKNFVTT